MNEKKSDESYIYFVFKYFKNMVFVAFSFSLGIFVIKGQPLTVAFSLPYSEVVDGVIICTVTLRLAMLNFLLAIDEHEFVPSVPKYAVFSGVIHIILFEVFIKC